MKSPGYMSKESDQLANERRRDEAARIIAENARSKRFRDTNEKLLDRETLRLAAVRAGLEKPGSTVIDTDWLPAAIICPPAGAPVEFTARSDDGVRVGSFHDLAFHDHLSSEATPMQEVLLWRLRLGSSDS
jgi:hypothetical protein